MLWQQLAFVLCSTASSRSHDSPAPSHVTANLVNILDEPLAPSELKEEPPSEHWDAFGAPAPPQPHTHLPPVQEGSSWAAFEQPGASTLAIPSQRAPPAPAAVSNNQAASWSAFDFDGQAGQQQAPQQQAVQPQQQQQQQQQQQGPPQQQQQQQAGGTARPVQAPAPAEPAKPPARQELPLVSAYCNASPSHWHSLCHVKFGVSKCCVQPMLWPWCVTCASALVPVDHLFKTACLPPKPAPVKQG